MLVRYIKKSLLTTKLNELDAAKHPDIIDLIHSLNLADLEHPFFQAENHTAEPHNQYELYLTYAHLSYLYLNKQLTYPGVEVDLSGFLSNIKIREQEEYSLPLLDKNDFLQSYLIHSALQSYPDKIKLFNASLPENKARLREYIKQLQKDFPMVPKDRLRQIIGSLSGINSIFFSISTVREEDQLLYTIMKPGGLINASSATPFNHAQIVPSIGFIHALAQECNPTHQITMEPIFGQINVDTLHRDFHQHQCHPVSLYSTWVQDNLLLVHDMKGSKLSVFMHDAYYHYIALCQFESQSLEFVTNELCPALKNLTNDKNLAINSSAILSSLFEKINDFAITPNTTEKENVWSYINSRIPNYFGKSEPERYRNNRMIDLLIMAIHSLKSKHVFIKTHYQIDVDTLLQQMVERLNIKLPPKDVISLPNLLNLVATHSANYAVYESISAINFLLDKKIKISTEMILLLVQQSHRPLTKILSNLVTQCGADFLQPSIADIREKIEDDPNVEEPSIPEYIRTAYLIEQTHALINRSIKKMIPKKNLDRIIEEIIPILLSKADITSNPGKPVRTYLEPFQPLFSSPTFFMFLSHFKTNNFRFSEQNWQNIINYGEMVGYDFTSIVGHISLITTQNIHLLTNEFLDLILSPPTYIPHTTTTTSSLSETQNQHVQHVIEIFDFLAKKIKERMPSKINFFHEKPPFQQLTFQQLLYAMNRENISQETIALLSDDHEFRIFSEKKEYSPIIQLFCPMQSTYKMKSV
ncbi:hypothetical protein J2N86_05875 [Legionella lytica]|uniref:Uncharacterized protein n=1 Tax=Legionella lytica TaxID=96232 RepID=A0ABY4YBS3_9GAMM|nr:hypothetical protein [Legionella lytica]USQ14828.1 hypothetical protein J2N86_05875 [Legionella lytica]